MALSSTLAEIAHDDSTQEESSQLELLLPQSDPGPAHILRRGSLVIDSDDDGYSYSYGPKGLAGLQNNRYALLCTVFASIGGLTFGYDQGVIANVLVMRDFMARWPIGPWEKGLMSASITVPISLLKCEQPCAAAVLELGALFGALSAGIFADRYSRRYSMFLACGMSTQAPNFLYQELNRRTIVVFCVGSAFQCGARSLTHLVFGRAVGGVGVGALRCVVFVMALFISL